MKKYDILIIGGGPAGMTISKILGKKMDVGMIRPEDHSMIYCAMPYAIEEIIPFEKTLKNDDIVHESGAELIRDRVTEIDTENKLVRTEKGEKYRYGKLVIASGAVPVLPGMAGSDLKGVMTFKTEDDLQKIIALSRGDIISKAVVVGAGAIGVELSQAFNSAGIETHLVDQAETILSNMIDGEMIRDAEEDLIRQGISLQLNSRVAGLRGTDRVRQVVLDNGETIDLEGPDDCTADSENNGRHGLVVFAVGMKVDREILNGTGIETGPDGIIVNGKMETNIEDIYSAGDCAQFSSGITGDILPGKLATNAIPMAKIFAQNQLGMDKKYPGFYNGAATKIGNFFAGGTGLTEKAARDRFDVVTGCSELTTRFPNMPGAKKVKMKIIADRKTMKILGAGFISGEPVTDKVDTMTLAIQNDLTVDSCAELSYSSQPYQSFFPASNLIVAAADDLMSRL